MNTTINYSEIIVKTQEELDTIPVNFRGRIYIEFGTCINCAIVRHRYCGSVVARGNSSVVARGNSFVVARDNSYVAARDNSYVAARDNSSVAARDNSSVEALDNSSVEALDNSSVVAWGNSSVEAWGNSQIINRLCTGRINIFGNARIVYMPKTITEYCDFYNIEHDEVFGKFYKCVHKIDGRYFSDHNGLFEYVIGEKAIPDSFDNDPNEDCGHGIHVAHLNWVLDCGRNWSDIAIIEVEAKLDDVVVPASSVGEVRCKEVKVLREVPLEECGPYGKILAKRLAAN